MVGEMHMGNQYIFAAAGGMFLYIALVDMVPEMNATMDQMSKVGVKNAMLVFLLQNIGILSGIVSLFVLAKFQDDIQIELWSVSVGRPRDSLYSCRGTKNWIG